MSIAVGCLQLNSRADSLLGSDDVDVRPEESGSGGLALVGDSAVVGAVEVGVLKSVGELQDGGDAVVVGGVVGVLPELVIVPLDGDKGGHHRENSGGGEGMVLVNLILTLT